MTMKLGYRDGGMTSEEGINRITSRLVSAAGVMGSGDFAVSAAGTPDNTVKVAVGDIVIGDNSPNTADPDFYYHGWNDAQASFTISANASGNPRIDVVVAYVDLSVVDDSVADNPGALVVKVVAGTAAATPAAPDDTAIQTDVGIGNPWMLLARVAVSNGFSTITNSDIIDLRIKSSTIARLADKGFQDFVGEGLVWSQKTGLIGKMTTGYAYINGELVGKSYLEYTFTATKDTYIDLPLGSKPTSTNDLTITAVTNGAASPALAANSVRLAKVVTDGSGITSVVASGFDSLGNPYMPTPISLGESSLSQAIQDFMATGWRALPASLTYNTANGNREYVLDSSANLTGVLSPGARLKLSRGTAAPTQCTDLEASSSQYANNTSPSGLVFTDDFTVEAWIKLESYAAGDILARRDGAPTAGWVFRVVASGQVDLFAGTGGAFDEVTSYQSVPLGRWVHVAASLNMSAGTAAVWIDGVEVPSAYTNSAATSLTQTGDLAIGRAGSSGTEYFDGKISDVRLWGVVKTAAQIRASMNKQLAGNETNLLGYWKLAGNFNDSQTNGTANNLTAQNSAAATNSDNPMQNTEYAIITKVTASQLTVFTGTDHNIPDLTLSTPYYSTQRAPLGFPAGKEKWRLQTITKLTYAQTSPVQNTWYHTNMGSIQLYLPIGAWKLRYETPYGAYRSGTSIAHSVTLSTANNSESHPEFTGNTVVEGANATISTYNTLQRSNSVSQEASGLWYANYRTESPSASALQLNGAISPTIVTAECEYV